MRAFKEQKHDYKSASSPLNQNTTKIIKKISLTLIFVKKEKKEKKNIKMAYMSDIDLATLHQTRLEEKFNYRLSWLTNHKARTSVPNIGDGSNKKSYNVHHKGDTKKTNNAVDSNVTKVIKNASDISNKKNNNAKNNKNNKQNVGCDSTKEILAKEIEARELAAHGKLLEFVDDDDGYFSSDARRRRSGTWP